MTKTTSPINKLSDEAIVQRLRALSDTLGTLEREAGEQMDQTYEESDRALAALEEQSDLDARMTVISEQAVERVEEELAETEEEIRREEKILDDMPVLMPVIDPEDR
jgi:hypothetical protein